MSIEAMYYEKMSDEKVRCILCPHNCLIKSGGLGVCRARQNIKGELHSLNYGEITSMSLDPIEKKPLNMFHPGSFILSVGTFGCNFKCSFCQNWSIAQSKPDTVSITSDELVLKAEKLKMQGNIGIAYTYNEPSIWYEFVLETAKKARQKGLVNVLVSNGFINEESLLELLPYIDAMNIDVKAYTEGFYSKVCGGELNKVKRIVEIASKKCHVEITTLLIPELNDSVEEIRDLAKWLSSISTEIPLHLSAFFPNYKMQNVPPTPIKTLKNAQEEARKFLNYVFLGNV